MSLNAFLKKLTQDNWLEVPNEVNVARGKISLTKQERRSLLENIEVAIANGLQQDATNNLYVGLVIDESPFLFELQKKGLLRISRHSYKPEPLNSIVTALLTPSLGLSNEVVDYLTSVSNLYQVARQIRREHCNLETWLGQEREIGIKSALAFLDFLFLKAMVGLHLTSMRHVASRHPFFFSVEDLAAGFSSLLALYGYTFGSLNDNPAVNEEGLLNGVYHHVLISGAHLSAYRDWEFQIDRQGYRLLATNLANEFRLEHPSHDFHQAIEFGYIQSSQQRALKTFEVIGIGGKSFHDYAPKFAAQLEEAGLIRFLEQPSPRIRFDFPADILTLTSSVHEHFLEEQVVLALASRDLLTPPKQLLVFEIDDGVTLRDLLSVFRIFSFIQSIAAATLIPKLTESPGLVFRSLIPCFDRSRLVEILKTAVSEAAAEKIIDLWTTDIQGHVDLQYRSLIPVGAELLLPVNVFTASNVFRNPLHVLRTRLYEDGRLDPLSILLDDKLRAKGHTPSKGFHYEHGEVDLLLMIDGILFAFECKNSLVPTGPHELMTTLDYVNAAKDQLDRFRTCFKDNQFKQWLKGQTGWPVTEATPLSTGIILSNRMFMGLRVNGHPVRGAYELEHFIDEGAAQMGEEVHKFWLGDSFTGEDLRRFLDDDITYLPQWKCLRSYDARFEFGACNVIVRHLYLDLVQLADEFGFTNAKQGLLDQQAALERATESYNMVDYYLKRRQGNGNGHE